ncbi:MAG TPA: hypothetical protein VKV21_15350 [Solirubrobacteraceae bacterium]|nr:hypothetical protein [Solirubrobacteraceae bacterium]
MLERKLKENPEFRCWRLRKHTSNYDATGEASRALQAHSWICPKCRAAKRGVQEQTYAALNPLLPGAGPRPLAPECSPGCFITPRGSAGQPGGWRAPPVMPARRPQRPPRSRGRWARP